MKILIERVAHFMGLHAEGYFRNSYQLNPLAVLLQAENFLKSQEKSGVPYRSLAEITGKEMSFTFTGAGDTVSSFKMAGGTQTKQVEIDFSKATKNLEFFANQPRTNFKKNFQLFLKVTKEKQ